jgi:hypothetical protein
MIIDTRFNRVSTDLHRPLSQQIVLPRFGTESGATAAARRAERPNQ